MYTDRRPNRMERVLRDIERDAIVLPEQRWPHASTRAPTKYEPVNAGPPPDSAYRTTLAAELRRASLEDEQELRRAVDAARRREEAERLHRQKQIGAEVAAVSARAEGGYRGRGRRPCRGVRLPRGLTRRGAARPRLAAPAAAQVLKPTFINDAAEREKRRRQFLEDQREKKENWERVKRQIETNVSKRPYLFEQASTAAHVDRARQERLEQFEKTLRDNGLGDLVDG